MKFNRFQKQKSLLFLLRKYYVLIFVFGIFCFWIFEIGYRNFRSYFLVNNSISCKAVIINEKNYYGNSPVSQEFSYSYSFEVEGTIYKGNSNESTYKLGDTILIEYVSFYPNFNRPKP